MSIRAMKLSPRALCAIAALLFAGAALSGCVYYPSGYGYGYAPAYYGPPVGVVIGGGWRGDDDR